MAMFFDLMEGTKDRLARYDNLPRYNSLWDWKVWDEWSDSIINKFTDVDGMTTYEVEVPGFNKDNLNVSMNEGVLSVSGERENVKGVKVTVNKRFVLNARDVKDLDAEVRDGILYIRVKEFEQPSSKRIELR